LLVDEYVVLDVIEVKYLKLSDEGVLYEKHGTPEYQYANGLGLNEEVPKTTFEEKLREDIAKIGFAKAMQKKWVQLTGAKKENIKRIAAELLDEDA
jgi:hypothetical protein